MSEISTENQIESLRRRYDAALQRRLENPADLSPASLIRILSPVIEKYLVVGMTMEEIAKVLREEGVHITRWHLVWHLGAIRAETGLPPVRRGRKKDEDDKAKTDESREKGGQNAVRASPPPVDQAAPPSSSAEQKQKLYVVDGVAPSALADEPIDPMVFDASKRPPPPDYHQLVAEGKMTREEVGEKARILFDSIPSIKAQAVICA